MFRNKRLMIIIGIVLALGFLVRPPVSGGKLTSPYGIRFFAGRVFHNGSDIALPVGSPVKPVSWGTIKETGFTESKGNFISISHLSIIQSHYMHLDTITSTVGQSVSHSTVIGTVGNTGLSTGPHIHFEIRVLGIPLPPYLLCLPGIIFKFVTDIFQRAS